MEVDTSWNDISQASLMESDDDIFASIDLSTISDPFPKIIHLDCHSDCSSYHDWVSEKCFVNVFPVDEDCLSDPMLLEDLFAVSRQTLLEMKILGQDNLTSRLSITNLLHFTLSEGVVCKSGIESLRSLLEDQKFLPTAQDGKQFVHGYFEWKLLLLLISMKTEGSSAEALKSLSQDILSYSLSRLGNTDLRNASPFPCRCFESMWSVIVVIAQKLSSEINVWTLLEIALQSCDNFPFANSKNSYKDSTLIHLWFLRHFPKCFPSHSDDGLQLEYREIVSRTFHSFLEKDPPEGALRDALYEVKIVTNDLQIPADTLIQLWEILYRRINTNFKVINRDNASSLLVPNDTSMSYITKIQSIVSNDNSNPEENQNLTSYEFFLELLVRCWQRATIEADPKYQQKLSNRILLKFSTKMWASMNEMGIHNLINLLLCLYILGDDRSLDRIENVLLTVPFPDITHNRRVAVFKGLAAILILFYEKSDRKNKNYPENFMKKFENAVGVDRFTGRQMVLAIDRITSGSLALNNREFLLINPWIKLYLNGCTDNDRDLLLETLNRVMERYIRLKENQEVTSENGEEVIRRIFQTMEGIVGNYLTGEQEVDITSFVANLFVCLKLPIPGLPLVDNLFSSLILNNIKNPRVQLKVVTKLVERERGGEGSVVHINSYIKALIKFLLVIDGPVMDLKPLLFAIKDTKEFQSFCSMDCDEFLGSNQPFAVFLKGIRASFETLFSDSERDRFYNRFEMFFQMYTKWLLPNMRTAEEAHKCYSNTTAVIYICGKVIYTKKTPNLLKTLISEFYLTLALLGKKAQPQVVTAAMVKVMDSLLGGLLLLNPTGNDEYLNSVIGDLIFHWTPQFANEFNISRAALPFLKFSKTHPQLAAALFDRTWKVMLTSQLQRDVIGLKILREMYTQSKADPRALKGILTGSLPQILDYYCKSEDFSPAKKDILALLEDISTTNFLCENSNTSAILDEVFEKWTLDSFHSPNYFELAIRLARLFPVNLRMILPKLRAEITTRNNQLGSGNFGAVDRMNHKMRNLEMILQQK